MNRLRLLEFAVALDHHRSFARAARAMHVTQPSFSRAIAALEADLGARLFDRSNREVLPTAAGRTLLARARRLLADHAAIGDALDDERTLRSGSVSVAAGPYPLEVSVVEAVVRLASRHPQLHIEVVEGDWRRMGSLMLSRGIELGLFDISLVATDHRFLVEPLPAHAGHFFCRPTHPLAGRAGLRLAELLAYPFVGVRGPYEVLADAAGASAGLTIDETLGDIVPRISATSMATVRKVVQSTDGFGLATLAQLHDDLQLGRLVTLDVNWPGTTTGYGLITLRGRGLSPAAAALAAQIREVESERAAAAAAVPKPPSQGHTANGPTRAQPARRREVPAR